MLRGSLSIVWSQYQAAGLGFHIKSSDRNAIVSAIAKVVRQIIQVSVLAMGGYLVIQDITSPGVMIATSIIIGRALAPIEQSIQGWRALSKVRESYKSLESFLEDYRPAKPSTPLPTPVGNIQFQNVVALGGVADGQNPEGSPQPKAIIKNISFQVMAGESVGITGPSGSGKSTLARLMLGVERPVSGAVRVDGAELIGSTQLQYSSYFGFLPQEIGLFDGTVAENIARFIDDDCDKVIEAAKLAGAHDLILTLPEGYETVVGPAGIHLSGGQKQRIGLARAVYGEPAIIVLDEPTSNLDNDGRLALISTLKSLKNLGSTVILIAHQPSLFTEMDKMGLIVDGQLQKFGPKDEIIQAMNPKKMVTKQQAVSGSSQRPSVETKVKNTKMKETTSSPSKVANKVTLKQINRKL